MRASSAGRRRARLWLPLLCALAASSTFGQTVRADEAEFGDIETKYIFGFTEGSGIGLEGEKEVSAETVASLGKRGGRFFADATKLEYEHTQSQFVQLEFGALLSAHDIASVPELEDRHALSFGGLFGELRYLLVERGASSPIAVTASIEPVWRRIDETGGDRVTNFEFETRLAADAELVPNQVFLGLNALYEPETTRTPPGSWEKESTLGISTALAVRVAAPLVIGAEVWYLRHYDTIGLGSFTGDAVYFGPSFYLQLGRKAFLSGAWNIQVAGHEAGQPGALDLADFSRHRAKLKLAVEF